MANSFTDLIELGPAAETMRRKVKRAVERGTGCRLSPSEAEALNFIESDGDWWNSPTKDNS
jgi:hypothetical protein